MCERAQAAIERLGDYAALAYFDGPDGDNLVILTPATGLQTVHAAFRSIAERLSVALYFSDNRDGTAALDDFKGWMSWRQLPQTWKSVCEGDALPS